MTNSDDIDNLNQKIEQLESELLHAQKLATVGELMSTTTHEFNNILMTIINYAKLGMRHKDESARTRSFDKILTASQRAAKICSSILAAAKNRSQKIEPTPLIPLIDDALLLLEREMTRYRIDIEKIFPSVLPDVMIDGNQIQQVLLNLLINARQAMPDGGHLLIKIDFDEENEMVDLLIRDFGSGIPADKLPHIFDRFFTTKTGPDESGKGGSGLGLSTCKSIIEKHHGLIRVESAVGKGTAFTLKLPTVVRSRLLEV
ncbi:MAG: sensor histidine kinase [Thermoguttaceae bacterium]